MADGDYGLLQSWEAELVELLEYALDDLDAALLSALRDVDRHRQVVSTKLHEIVTAYPRVPEHTASSLRGRLKYVEEAKKAARRTVGVVDGYASEVEHIARSLDRLTARYRSTN